MSNIIIGKHTLESLTFGMYDDPFAIYREYIQNAVDSIDTAYKCGHLTYGEELVSVSLYPIEDKVVIRDNGMGVSCINAYRTLMSIGNSKKSDITSRGFRGIGRLAALSYCEKLIFETSYPDENVGSKVTFDASLLAKLLTDKYEENITLEDVLSTVSCFEEYSEVSTEHYFQVTLYGIKRDCNLFDYALVKNYLEQVCPVPYNDAEFTWGKEINNRIKQGGYKIPAYNIVLKHGLNRMQISKQYRDNFLVDKARNVYGYIQDIEVYSILDAESNLVAILWVGYSDYSGSIVDRGVKGLRTRQGNMLIGDSQTLNSVFKKARFNGWTVGEVFAVDNRIVPNARRDNFEKNSAYFMFSEQLTHIAFKITAKLQNLSLSDNSKLLSAIENSEALKQQTSELLTQQQTTRKQRSMLKRGLTIAHKNMSKLKAESKAEEVFQEIAFEELDMLIGKAKGATVFKSINVMPSLSTTEKKVLERVFEVLQHQLSNKETEETIQAILTEFS